MVCPNCSAINRDGARSCRKCGYRLSAPPSADVLPSQVKPGTPAVPSQTSVTDEKTEPPPEQKTAARVEPEPAKTEVEKAELVGSHPEPVDVQPKPSTADLPKAAGDSKPSVDPEMAAAKEETPKQTAAEELRSTSAKQTQSAPSRAETTPQEQTAITTVNNKSHRRGYAFAAIIAAVVGTLGGYTAGSRGGSAVQQLRTEIAQGRDALSKSNAKITQLSSELAAEKQRTEQLQQNSIAGREGLQKTIDELQRDLQKITADRDRIAKQIPELRTAIATAQGKQREAEDAALQKVKQAETAANQRIQQLTNQLRDTQNELAALKKKPIVPEPPVPAKSGFLVWSGDLTGKKTIEIKDGIPNMGRLTAGALPGRPCTIVPADPSRVKIKGKPSAENRWNRLAFEVSGYYGPTDIRIYWTLH